MSGAISQLREGWANLAHGAVWLFSIIATFVVTPDFLDGNWKNLARFLLAVLLGLEFLGAYRSRTKKAARLWLIVAIGSVVLTVVAYFAYDALRANWIVPYPGGTVIRGATYTDFAESVRKKDFNQNGHYPDDERLVLLNAGPKDLWRTGEVETRKLWLAALYLLNFLSPASTIIAVTQFVACRNPPSGPSKPPAENVLIPGR